MDTRFEWDRVKEVANLKKHGIGFEAASDAFKDPFAIVAGILGCSESAVKSLLFRAYEALRLRLRHFSPGGSGQKAN